MSAHESTQKKHASFGDKLKGAAHIVHGMGEDVRGSMMGAFESVSGSEEARAKDEGIVTQGRSEIEQGIAQMKGIPSPGGTAAAPEPHAEGKTGDKPQEKPIEEVSTKGAAVPTTTAAPESHAEGKTGDQPQEKPTKEVPTQERAVPGTTTSGPESQMEGKTSDQSQEKPTKEVSGPTPVPPPSPIQSRQTEQETGPQQLSGQTSTKNVQKSNQETQTASETKSPQTAESFTRRGAAPQGPGGSV